VIDPLLQSRHCREQVIIIMSTRLLRKILKQTNEKYNSEPSSQQHELVKTHAKKSKGKESTEANNENDNEPRSKEEFLHDYIQSMLTIDQSFSFNTKARDHILKRKRDDQKQQTKIRKKIKLANDSGFNNSRSSCSRYHAAKTQEPTFNKARAEKEKELKTIRNIAKMFKKNKPKSKENK